MKCIEYLLMDNTILIDTGIQYIRLVVRDFPEPIIYFLHHYQLRQTTHEYTIESQRKGTTTKATLSTPPFKLHHSTRDCIPGNQPRDIHDAVTRIRMSGK